MLLISTVDISGLYIPVYICPGYNVQFYLQRTGQNILDTVTWLVHAASTAKHVSFTSTITHSIYANPVHDPEH